MVNQRRTPPFVANQIANLPFGKKEKQDTWSIVINENEIQILCFVSVYFKRLILVSNIKIFCLFYYILLVNANEIN